MSEVDLINVNILVRSFNVCEFRQSSWYHKFESRYLYVNE